MSPATTSGRRPCRALTVGPECPRGLRAQLYAGHMSAVLEDAYSNARRYEGERRLYATGRVTADAQQLVGFPTTLVLRRTDRKRMREQGSLAFAGNGKVNATQMIFSFISSISGISQRTRDKFQV